MLDEEELVKLRRAGRIASEVRRWAEINIKDGMRILDICEAVEAEIVKRGGQPAFPCNVDVNEVGAHYTSPPGDESRIPPSSLVKVDLGVHVDGYIADTATTICLNYELLTLKQAADEALAAALGQVRSGARASDIGGLIQQTIEKYGLKPIRNLTGHGLARYMLHTGRQIPNVRSQGSKLELGEIYAIEPFTTTSEGAGEIREQPIGYIYRIIKEKPPKDRAACTLLEAFKRSFQSLPFAMRWAIKASNLENFQSAFRILVKEKYLMVYPVLSEKKLQPVAQAEHTVIVLEDGVEVTTL